MNQIAAPSWVALLAASPRVVPLAASLPGLRLVILLASPLAAPRMLHKPWAARKPLAPHRLAVRTIGLVAVSLIRGKTVSTLVTRRRVKGKLEASLMPCQAAQALA